MKAFVGEHCTDEYERITSSFLLFIATLVDKTSKIRLEQVLSIYQILIQLL